MGRAAYRRRVQRLLRSRAAQTVSKRFFQGLRKTAIRVVRAKGAAVKG